MFLMKTHFWIPSIIIICPPDEDKAIPTALNAIMCKIGIAGAYSFPQVYIISQYASCETVKDIIIAVHVVMLTNLLFWASYASGLFSLVLISTGVTVCTKTVGRKTIKSTNFAAVAKYQYFNEPPQGGPHYFRFDNVSILNY